MLWNKSYFYFCLWFHGERFWSWPFLHYFLGFQLKVQDLISAFMRVDAHGVQAFKWWNCTGKNPLHSSLAVMTRVECWMFQINRVFFYTVFPRSVNYWILFRPIAASGCHQKKKKLFNFYLFPVSLGQVCPVLDLTSTNRQARNHYPEMVMALTGI